MVLQFKIQIKGITKPPVWRRISIPSHFTFHQFHIAIQTAFGWYNCHLYQFSRSGYSTPPFITIPEEEVWIGAEEQLDSMKIKLSDVFTEEKQKFTYIYDFGDDWTHSIVLEKMTDEQSLLPQLLAGKGACPLEDIGGVWGYEDFKQGSVGGSKEDYQDTLEWHGLDDWDSAYFDLKESKQIMVNAFSEEN